MANETQTYTQIWEITTEEIKSSFFKWVARRNANKRYSKPVDLIATGKNGEFLPIATKFLIDFNRQHQLQALLWNSEEKASLEGYFCVLYDFDDESPILRLAENIFNTITYKNNVILVKSGVKLFENKLAKANFWIIEERPKFGEIKRYIGDSQGNKIENADFLTSNLPEEQQSEINDLLNSILPRNEKTPNFTFQNNLPNAEKDGELVKEEIQIYAEMWQKLLDELNLNTTKVVTTDGSANESDDKELNSSGKATNALKQWAARSVIAIESLMSEGSADSAVIPATPATAQQIDAINSIANLMLKKMGAATDVDAKGTVQQSKSEIIMAQGNEYETSAIKTALRQSFLQELFESVKLIFENEISVRGVFKNFDSITVILDENEVLSQTEMIANLSVMVDRLWLPDLMAKARILGISIYEAWKMQNISFAASQAISDDEASDEVING